MSEEFRRKLQDYEEGKLSEEEQKEVERELEKMEVYQAHVDELLGKERGEIDKPMESRKEAKIIRRGKWKARINTVFSVLLIFVLVTWAGNIFNSTYFGEGDPSRADTYGDVASFAIMVTHPNVSAHVSGSMGGYLSYEFTGELKKQIGSERYTIGQFMLPFRLGLPGIQKMTWSDDHPKTGFFNPPDNPVDMDMQHDWNKLEKLPEGTVAEAYLSFDQYFTTDEILKQFEGKNLEPVWFAVDAGQQESYDPIGFPYDLMWHHDDLTITNYKEEKSGWFGKTVMQGGTYPAVEAYGSGELRNENFIKTLRLIQDYPSIARKVAPFVDFDQITEYVEANGVKIYGAVVTGPTKELLRLKQESWVKGIQVSDARLWNWIFKDTTN
ncbi:anti sigma factor C-terminal domain-containing protein [Paenibacillus sp. GCM10028914]|uniref:anti-sigma factor n=1 Tax=Paenibacillus sp. GCM10028914 TaxID=3273416 RepID=UPI003605E11E